LRAAHVALLGDLDLRDVRRVHREGALAEHREDRSEEHTSELQSREKRVWRLLLDKKHRCTCPTYATERGRHDDSNAVTGKTCQRSCRLCRWARLVCVLASWLV